jgi:hypothetical protein
MNKKIELLTSRIVHQPYAGHVVVGAATLSLSKVSDMIVRLSAKISTNLQHIRLTCKRKFHSFVKVKDSSLKSALYHHVICGGERLEAYLEAALLGSGSSDFHGNIDELPGNL